MTQILDSTLKDLEDELEEEGISADEDYDDYTEPKTVQSEQEKTKQQRAKDFLTTIVEAENAIQPFKDHIKDVKTHYSDNMWLDKAEQSALIRALRMAQKKPYTMEQFMEAAEIVKNMNINED